MNTGARPTSRRAFALVGFAAALVLMWTPGPIGAAPGSNTDPDDVALKLDLKSVSHADDGSSITYIAETYEDFSDNDAAFKWGIDTNGDESFDLIAFAEWDAATSGLIAAVDDAAENEVARGTVSRPAPNSIQAVFPISVLGGISSYRYGASAEQDLNGNGESDPGEQDLAPDAGLYTHNLGSAPASQAPVRGVVKTPVASPAPAPVPAPAVRPGPVPAPVAVPESRRVPTAASPAVPVPAPAPAPAATPKAVAPSPKTAAGAPTQEVTPQVASDAPTPAAPAPEALAAPDTLARTGSGHVVLALLAGLALIAAGSMFFAETLVPTTRPRA